MELGYSITSYFPPTVTPSQAANAVLERARVARDAGYDYVETGDHHVVTGGGYLQNVPMAARLTDIFDRVAPLFLLPLWDPIIVAEQVGTLTAFADIDFWCAVGGTDQVRDYGIPPGERAGRIEEAIALIEELWAHDEVTFDGNYYTVEGVSVNPKADPRMYLGGTAESAVRRAARMGDVWVANADVPVEDLGRLIGYVEDEGGADLGIRRDALALPDGEYANELAHELLEDGYRGWTPEGDRVLAGDADEIADKLVELRELGISEVVVRPMNNDHASETLREVAAARDQIS